MLASYIQLGLSITPAFADGRSLSVEATIGADDMLSYTSTYTPELVKDETKQESVVWAKNCDLSEVDDISKLDLSVSSQSVCEEILTPDQNESYFAASDGIYYIFVNSTITVSDEVTENFFAYSFVEKKTPTPITPDPVVYEVILSKGEGNTLVYDVIDETAELGNKVFTQKWYKDCKIDEDKKIVFEECAIFETNKILSVSESGKYYVRVFEETSSVDDGSIPTLIGEGSLVVTFPNLEDAQFANLEYKAGERFTLSYKPKEPISALSAKLDSVALVTTANVEDPAGWTIVGGELLVAGESKLSVTASSAQGFTVTRDFPVTVKAGLVSPENSTLQIMKDNVVADYVEVSSGVLDIVFEAFDKYQNKIEIKNLDRVEVRFNGELLGGVDYIGKDVYRVERTVEVPSVEDLDAKVTVDVFDETCKGKVIVDGVEYTDYCFGKVADVVIYDTLVSPVSDLAYETLTNEDEVMISGRKASGYGVKINSTAGDFVVEPNDSTVFSFKVTLAEGVNVIKVFAAKAVSEDLVFYSKSESATIEKDSTVGMPVWGNPAIVLTGEKQATLYWTDPIYLNADDDNFSHVNIYRSTVPNFVPSEENLIVQTHNPSWTDTGLTAGTTYYYAMEAVDTLGNTSGYTAVQSTGSILGESATIYASEEETVLYTGKGSDEDIYGNGTGGGGEEEENVEENENQNEETQNEESNITTESETKATAKIGKFFSDAFNSTKTLVGKVLGNIFVQICLGGILIFIGLMFLISLLVWVKEKVVDARMVSLDETDNDTKLEESKKEKKNK